MDVKEIFGLTGKNVAITGSASGMSRAATELLIALRANVYAVDIADIDLPVTAAFKADLSSKEQIDAWLASLPETIDAVFMCHGIPGKPGIWHKMMQINFFSQKYAVEELLPRMSDGASVTFISSMGGLGWQNTHKEYMPLIEAEDWDAMEAWYETNAEMVESNQNPYAISKRAICSYVARKCMDPAFVAKHVRVNSICPGMTNTGLTDQFAEGAGGGDVAEGTKRLDATFTAVWGGQNATIMRRRESVLSRPSPYAGMRATHASDNLLADLTPTPSAGRLRHKNPCAAAMRETSLPPGPRSAIRGRAPRSRPR